MGIFIVSKNDEDYLRKALDFIKGNLAARKISQSNILKAQLIAEENIVLLFKHAPEDANLHIFVTKSLGEVSIALSMKGEEFQPAPGLNTITENVEDDETEDAIRAVFLKAYGERYKYRHANNINKVRILAEKSNQASLYATLIAMVMGLIVGFVLKDLLPKPLADAIRNYAISPFKTMFMNALRIVIAPVIFFSLVTCFSQFKNLTELGRMAAKIITFYMITTLVATFLGYLLAMIIRPGQDGFALTSNQIATNIIVNSNTDFSILNTIINIVPDNFLTPFTNSDTLQIMFLAVIIGIALGMIGDYSSVLTEIFEACNSLFLTITTMIARLIPVAAFCSVTLMIMDMGSSSFVAVLQATGVHILTVLLMLCVYGLLVFIIGRLNPIRFFLNAKEGMLTSFSLSSSSAAMPGNLKICIEKMGIAPKLCNFSIPLGATINMDGTCIFLSSFGIFLARAYGVQLTSSMFLSMTLTIILLSLGSPGVPGNGLVCLGILLVQIGVPIEAIGLVMAIYPIVDMFDTLNNTTGDMAATLVVGRLENMVDIEIFNSKK